MKKKSSALRNFVSFLWVKNPMMIYGLSVATAVMTTASMTAALSACIALAIMMLPTALCALLMGNKLRIEIRLIIYTLVASVAYIPAVMAVRAFSPQSITALSIYLPLLAINELIVLRADRYVNMRSISFALIDVIGCVVSFTISMLFISFIRELFGNGSLFGHSVGLKPYPALLLPFMGFIIAGFSVALFKQMQTTLIVIVRRYRHKKLRTKKPN